ncbi:MAG: TlpA family protein disulfide reductase [Myxococcales bacterium]|nr:TlpA family protein disulfide reductase [Myxococcales bacterium]
MLAPDSRLPRSIAALPPLLALAIACSPDAKPAAAAAGAAQAASPQEQPSLPTPVPAAQPAAATAPEPTPVAIDNLVATDGPGLLELIRKGPHRAALVNVWASWCGNCKREMPIVLRVAEAMAEHGIGLYLVSADTPEKRADASAFLAEHGGGHSGYVVAGRLGPFKRALHPTWKGSIPSTFLFDREGRLLHSWLGPVYEHELQPVLQLFAAGQLTP